MTTALRARSALRSLSPREQQLVILKVYEEKSYREISEITGLTSGNVGYILHHAMRKMAQLLKKGGGQ
jgi:RNA polymerase sigma-70 factor (ECF subfamily)